MTRIYGEPGFASVPAPTDVTVTTTGTTTQTVAWSMPNDIGQTEGFELHAANEAFPNIWVPIEELPSTARQYNATGLTPNTNYGYRIRSFWDAPDVPPGVDLSQLLYYENFDQYSIGAKPRGGFSRTYVTNATSVTAGKSASMSHNMNGSDGWGQWGMNIQASGAERLQITGSGNGNEMWYRTHTWFPSNFNMRATSGGRLKFHRFARKGYPLVNRHHVDLYLVGGSEQTVGLQFIAEGPEHRWVDCGTYTKGSWRIVEYYVRFGSVPRNAGGISEVRVWVDGNKVMHTTDYAFWSPSWGTGFIEMWRLHTIWNGGNPNSSNPGEGREHYIDSFAIAVRGNMESGGWRDDTPHMDRDAEGFPFIGKSVL